MSYFEKFPTFEYNGRVSLDLTRRVTIRSTVRSDPKVYRAYDVMATERPDHISDGYYGQSSREWMVLLSAGIQDPYHDWYLSDRDLANHIISKYGSLEEAIERIHHWEVNWTVDDEITPQDYGNLPEQLKKYYEPVFGNGTAIISYERRAEDVVTWTNMIVTVDLGSDHSFKKEDRVQVLDGPSLEGQAEVCWSNTTHVKLAHVQAPTEPGLIIRGTGGNESVITSREYTSNTIPIDERPYWAPVSFLDWERDRNESRKSVRLIDNRFASRLEDEMERLLRE